MLTNSTLPRIDDQRKGHIDAKGPKQMNRPKQLQTHNLPTDDVKNINSTNKARDLPLAHNRINLKECEKKDKYLNLARELKKLWNMKVTIVQIVIGTLGTITKGLFKGVEDLEVGGRVETI